MTDTVREPARGRRAGWRRLAGSNPLRATIALGAAAFLAACSSSSSSSSSVPSTTPSTASSSTATTSSGATGAATGTPYKVVYISDITGTGGLFTPYVAALQASVNAVNGRGGVNGHPIDLVVCDSQASASATAQCGQEAVSDNAIAVIAYDTVGAEFPYLEKADIPEFNFGITQASFSSPVSVMIADVALVATFGASATMASVGCKSFADISPTLGNAALEAASAGTARAASAKFNIKFDGNIYVPATAPDMSSYVAEAVHTGAECIYVALQGGTQPISALTALENYPQAKKVSISADNLEIAGAAGAIGPVVQKLGSRLVLVAATEPPSAASTNPMVKQWIADEASDKSAPLATPDAIQWAELQLLVQAAKAAGPDTTGAKILAYVNKLSNYWPGVFPSVNFTKAVPNSLGPRVFAAWAAPAKFIVGTTDTTQIIGNWVSLLTGQSTTNTGS